MKIGKDGWLELSPESDMNEEQRVAFQRMKEAYSAYKDCKDYYESAMLTLAPQGKTLVFGYNFGKASIKIVEASERRAKREAKPQATLADYLSAMSSGGHRA